MVLAPIGRLRPTQIIDVQLNVLPGAPRPIRTRSRVRVHLGSAEVLARVRVLNVRGEIASGETAFAQLRFESPVIALHGERFIIRSYSPAETIAGGVVLDPHATKHRGKELSRTNERLRALTDEDPLSKFIVFVAASGDLGLRAADIAARTGWTDEVISQVAIKAREAAIVEAEGVFVAKDNFERLAQTALEAVKLHHQREPLSRGLARETLRERYFAHATPEIFRALISHLEKGGALVTEKDLVRASEHGVELSPADIQLREKIAGAYEKAGLEAPVFDQVLEAAGVAATQRGHGRKILQLLIDDGTLIRVQGEMFCHSQALTRLKEVLSQYAKNHEPDRLIDVAKFKELAGVSRKYAIPLLEYLDSQRITRRAGDKRVVLK
jgi:selenocysteine-specific elongation factor